MIRSSSCSSLKRSIGTQQDAGENLKESSTGAPHVEVEEPSRRCESAVPGPSKKRRKRTPEWQVCQEFEGLGKKKKNKKKKKGVRHAPSTIFYSSQEEIGECSYNIEINISF